MNYREKLNQLKGKKNFLEKNKKEKKDKLFELSNRIIAIEGAQVFIQNVAKKTQEKLKYCIEDIVQLALDAVFPNEYDFQVEFEIKRGRTEAKLSFLKHGESIDPISAAGGGVVDVASFALRLAVWSLGKTAKTIILDEPMKFLSKDKIDQAGMILKKLSEKLGIQVIMVTHIPELTEYSDRVFRVEMKKEGQWKKSYVKVEKN